VRDAGFNGWWRIGSAITAVLTHLVFRIRVRGVEHIPPSGPAILAFNHVSVLDGPVLAIATAREARRATRFLVAAEIFHRRFFGWILRTFEQIPIRRGQGDEHALDEAIRVVADGALAAIAPEGRVNADGGERLQRIRSGVARIAIPTGAPVVPVGIWGTQVRWPRNGLTFRRPLRPVLAFAYGPPVTPPADEAGRDAFLEELGSAITIQVAAARFLAGDPP
jgi:1-acyl-sn-glycerol-3-phosphate acyltransferase